MSKSWTIGPDTSRARQKEGTRKRILEAAVELFETKGFHVTTISDIAKAAGVSSGSIYAHFGSPAQIMADLHRRLVASRTTKLTEMRSNWPEGETKWDLFVAMLTDVWGMNKTSLQMGNVSAFHAWRWMCPIEDFAPMREVYGALFAEFETTLSLGQKEGSVPAGVDITQLIEITAVMFFHGIQEARVGEAAYNAQYELFIDRVHMLFGIERRKAAAA